MFTLLVKLYIYTGIPRTLLNHNSRCDILVIMSSYPMHMFRLRRKNLGL
jgi:hypothetical protein